MAINSIKVQGESTSPKEPERLQYFAGTWHCRQPADSTEPSVQFTWQVQIGLNNFWYLGNAS
ncbi:MAG: hypothetical protein AAF298_06030 [Cyanobacteria bacterium P01_A01_bin.40]